MSIPRPASARRSDWVACLVLTWIWLVPVVIVGTHGEFPLNDDWAYAETTRAFLEDGRFEPPEWTYAPVVTNVAVGVLFASVLDLSFETLRLSNVFFGWVGLLGAYALCRAAGAAPRRAVLGAVLAGASPIGINLAFTFMTDVVFTACCTWSLFFLYRAFASRSPVAAVAGALVAAAAILSRQPGLALLAAAALAWLAARPTRALEWLVALALVAAVALSLVLGPAPVVRIGDAAVGERLLAFVADVLRAPFEGRRIAGHGLIAVTYLGLLLAPAALEALPALRARAKRALWLGTGGATAAFAGLALADMRMPLGGNVIYDFGLGAPSLPGALMLPGLPAWVWWVVTAVSLLSAGWLAAGAIAWVAGRGGGLRTDPGTLMLLLFPGLYAVPLLGTVDFFDRYLLPMLPPLAALVLAVAPAPRPAALRIAAPALAALLLLYGVVGTRDYLEHHRARWVLLGDLLDRGVPPSRIDGGFEFEGWFKSTAAGWLVDPGVHKEFVLAHVTVPRTPGYRRVDFVSYLRLLPPRREYISLYQRIPEGESGKAE